MSLPRSRWPHCGEYLISWVPKPLQCCKKGRLKNRARARALLNSEMNLVKIIQKQRYYARAFEQILSTEQRHFLQQGAEFIVLDDIDKKNASFKDGSKAFTRFGPQNENIEFDDSNLH